MVSLDEVMLLFRGFAEKGTPLRVAVRSIEMNFSASCTVFKAEDGRVAFWIGDGEDSAVDFLIENSVFEFQDSPPGEDKLPLSKRAESCISVFRPSDRFGFIVMPLRDED
jgi:hypothetical protein